MGSSDRPRQSVPRQQGFHKLMPFRVREILLVASRYDAFILEEEGKVTDLILQDHDGKRNNF